MKVPYGKQERLALRKNLFTWYRLYGRKLPWRQTKDPYLIWVSEVMLQQTQVERVKEYYLRFAKRFPSVEVLAEASWEELLEYWRGLGYYNRARNLHKTAKLVLEKYQGRFPQDYLELQKFPGIGLYTAAAIASFAFDRDLPALDTNLQRIFERFFGKMWNNLKMKEKFHFALQYISKGKGAIFNHALMDLGATICTVKNPGCAQCPLQTDCSYQKIARFKILSPLLTLKSPKLKNSSEDAKNFLKTEALIFKDKVSVTKNKKVIKVAIGIIKKEGKILISKRRADDNFGGFWEFPGGKLESGENERSCLKREMQEELGIEVAVRPAFYRETVELQDKTYALSFHRCSILLGEPKALEVEQFLWVFSEQLVEYKFLPTNQNIINLLM